MRTRLLADADRRSRTAPRCARSTVHARISAPSSAVAEHVAGADLHAVEREPRLGVVVRRVLALARHARRGRVDDRDDRPCRRPCARARARGRRSARPGTQSFTPSSTPAVAVGRRRRGRSERVGAGLGERRRARSSRRRRRPAAARPAARRVPKRGDRQRAEHDGRVVRDRRDGATDLLEHERDLEEAVARRRPAPRAPRCRARPASASFAHSSRSKLLVAALDLLQALVRAARPRGSASRGPGGPAAPPRRRSPSVVSSTGARAACRGRTPR